MLPCIGRAGENEEKEGATFSSFFPPFWRPFKKGTLACLGRTLRKIKGWTIAASHVDGGQRYEHEREEGKS